VGDNQLLKNNTDYGHSIKSFWMLQQIGEILKDEELITFAENNASQLLSSAFDTNTRTWTKQPYLDSQEQIVRDENKNWWIYSELDQMSGTLCLKDGFYCDNYLESTVNWWLDNMVDKTYGEVWEEVKSDGSKIGRKQWEWKNGFHSYEHALVGYVTSELARGNEIQLYFANTDGNTNNLQPYYYDGNITQYSTELMPTIQDTRLQSFLSPDLQRVSVRFQNLQTQNVPEPLTIIGSFTALGFGLLFRKKLNKS
jgi:hypothetical protein